MNDVSEGKYLPIELALRLIESWHRGPAPLPAWNELHRACQEPHGPTATGCPNGGVARRISANEWSRAKQVRDNPSSIAVGSTGFIDANASVDPARWWAEYKGLKGTLFTSVHINADELTAWLTRQPGYQPPETAAVGNPPNRPAPEELRRGKGGRSPKHDWPAITAEIVGRILRYGPPNPRADLVKDIEAWAQTVYGEDSVPAKSEIEKQVSRSIDQLKRAKLLGES
jgi:hypothetical protein